MGQGRLERVHFYCAPAPKSLSTQRLTCHHLLPPLFSAGLMGNLGRPGEWGMFGRPTASTRTRIVRLPQMSGCGDCLSPRVGSSFCPAPAGYMATTGGIWPYTYNSCGGGDVGAEMPGANKPQLISACPDTPGFDRTAYGLNRGQGRGAPEIDVVEMK